MLDGSPILDIKPYLPYSDSFPDVKTGWAKSDLAEIHHIIFNAKSKKVGEKLKTENNINLFDYARIQLEFNPIDVSRKRISKLKSQEGSKEIFVLSYQDWQIHYLVDEIKKKVKVLDFTYSPRKKQ